MDEIQYPALIISVSIALALGTGIFKLVGMRARVHEKWSAQVSLTKGALESAGANQLYAIYAVVRQNLDADGQYQRDQAPFQPFELKEPVASYMKCSRYWHKMDARIRALRSIGPSLMVTLTLAFVPVVCLILHALRQLSTGSLQTLGIGFSIPIAIALVTEVALYAILEHRLTNAQILASEMDEV
ncbi:MAG: hypothetical protein OXH86_14845 [Acidimicrobiaceae bacterium]|nr:hypothetical protein [Acidimicrobiaceae bacterium]